MSSSVEQSGDEVLLECCRWWLAEAGVVYKVQVGIEIEGSWTGLG
jgi:hypothetical protein